MLKWLKAILHLRPKFRRKPIQNKTQIEPLISLIQQARDEVLRSNEFFQFSVDEICELERMFLGDEDCESDFKFGKKFGSLAMLRFMREVFQKRFIRIDVKKEQAKELIH